MKPSEYLDAARVALGAPSDYALQKPLLLSKQQIGRYRKNLDFFSDEVCVRIAAVLGKEPALVMLDMHRERSKERSPSPEVQAAWTLMLEKFSMGFEVLMSCVNPRGTRLSA
ncbi:MAG TPA: hypothetical protein VEC35_23350 [Noviherbaspirillum sp.]|nr:hypothetical protein [Noviherbaspirillum sp.]